MPVAVLIVAGLLLGFGILTYAIGGTSVSPPHWFYIPIAIASARFGPFAAIMTGLISGAIAGPLMPADVELGIAQATSDWVGRTVFFVFIGWILGALVKGSSERVIDERDRAVIARRLNTAVKEGQLTLRFQPIVAARTGRIAGAEALLRWVTRDLGTMTAVPVITAAEASGRMVHVGEWVIREACSTLRQWSATLGDRSFYLAVNVAPVQLQEPGFVDTVLEQLDSHLVPPSRLCIEVTESTLIEDKGRAVVALNRLREAGVTVALDDFGTGQSSLAYLQDLPFDIIKIDGSFLRDLGRDRRSDVVVRIIARFAGEMEKETIAEQVETYSQWRGVTEIGCTHGQGFLFSPPLASEELLALIASRRIWAPGRDLFGVRRERREDDRDSRQVG